MKFMDVTELNAIGKVKALQHPRDILHAALCISTSAFFSIGLIVYFLT